MAIRVCEVDMGESERREGSTGVRVCALGTGDSVRRVDWAGTTVA